MHRDHRPENVEIHPRSREPTREGGNGIQERKHDGDQRNKTVDTDGVPGKAPDDDEGNSCKKQEYNGTRDHRTWLEQWKGGRDTKEYHAEEK